MKYHVLFISLALVGMSALPGSITSTHCKRLDIQPPLMQDFLAVSFETSEYSAVVSAQHDILSSITMLQPKIEETRASRLSHIIYQATRDASIHPQIITAIAMRESEFREDIEVGRVVGSRGEVGLMQIIPHGSAWREGHGCNQRDAKCNITTGVRWLEKVKQACHSRDPWVWVAAYGMRKCPSRQKARRNYGVRLARSYFCRTTHNCQRIWPE